MKKYFLTFLIIVLFLNIIASYENKITCGDISNMKETIMKLKIPSSIPYENEILNIYLENEIFSSIEIKERKIINLSCLENSNPTYNIKIKAYSTIQEIIQAEDSFSTIKTKIENREIEIQGIGVLNKIKIYFTKLLLKWFT